MDTTPGPGLGIPHPSGSNAIPTQGETSIVSNISGLQPSGAAAAAQQPKVVQTAFIHKLYKLVLHRFAPGLFHN